MFSSVLLFLNIGGPEMILIIFVALLLFGGEKLPEIARGLGKGIRDFKDASEGVKREITNQINNYEDKKAEEAAVNSAPVTEGQNALPAADEHVSSEHPEAQAHEIDPPNPLNEIVGVANTMPFVENQGTVLDDHVNEPPAEASKATDKTKPEPVKTTHE
jgi:sec-independent protein translocase protein TatA